MESIEYKGFTINIYYDEFAESPFDWYLEDELIITYKKGSSYILGNKAVDPEEWEENEEKKLEETHFIFPVYAYIHGNVALSLHPFSCPWDSGRSGTMYVKKTLIEGYEPEVDENAKGYKLASDFIKTLNKWLSGEVFYYTVEGTYLGQKFNESLSSIYSKKEAISYAKGEIDAFIKGCDKKYGVQLNFELS